MSSDTQTYVLLPGAGGDAWYWHRVVPRLRERGHEAIAADLPAADDSAGLAEYADAAVAAIGDRRDVILVAQSMAAFSAPMACARADVARLVLVAPMIPAPGETPGGWWSSSGQEAARRAQDVRGPRSRRAVRRGGHVLPRRALPALARPADLVAWLEQDRVRAARSA